MARAKAEHKYIFVDCYATWCGPCKQMDQEVYPLKPVGDVYNREFISVKVQMDRTPTDLEEVKQWYGTADWLSKTYHIGAYPTFLFFNDEGKPVHKVSVGLNAKQFMQLARDAKNPTKQYYHILEDFRPGKLDTAEEKGLSRSFYNSDRALAGKLAGDYLKRIQQNQLGSVDNGKLMVLFQDAPSVLEIIVNYLKRLPKTDFEKTANLSFVAAMNKQTAVKEIAVNYIVRLDKAGYENTANLEFMEVFHNDPKVQELAKRYIDQLPEENIFTKEHLRLLLAFTPSPGERGFTIFYNYTARVDSVMGDGFGESKAEDVITKAEFVPSLKEAEASGAAPDWQSIGTAIEKKYGKIYADRVIIDNKVSWYRFLVKKEPQYWHDLVAAKIAQINKFMNLKKDAFAINNAAYNDIFLHSNDTAQLHTAIKWMSVIVTNPPDRFQSEDMDTYASVLYKAGRLNEALEWEDKALQIATEQKNKEYIDLFTKTIKKMKNSEKFWEEKEYQQ